MIPGRVVRRGSHVVDASVPAECDGVDCEDATVVVVDVNVFLVLE